MTPERWQQASRIYEAALEREPAAREVFLADACGEDRELRREVDSLLADESTPVLIDSPIWDVAGDLLDGEMELARGTRVGPYRIEAVLGAGGMGQVYRARDLQLERDVALKVLPDVFADDPERLARFTREAHVLASLNHPGIAAIYGFENVGAVHALVLELVDGPTLADRLAHGPILLDEALPIAHQIAQAVASAHEQGIIHRDLKPANIKVRDDGTVKVLDLGLAKALDALALTTEDAPTTNRAMTQIGAILGSAAYMSPEQATGRVVDKRTDVWAFGCVVYEMLTATRAFSGDDGPATLAAVLKDAPDWRALPADLPASVNTLLTRCLIKDRRQRITDLSIASYVLAEAAQPPSITARPAADRLVRRPHLAAAVAGVAVGAVLTGVVGWTMLQRRATEGAPISRLELVTSAAQPLAFHGINRDIAISPDGADVLYRAGNATQWQLLVRSLREREARPLPNTSGGNAPFYSPDGRWIAFSAGAKLRKTSSSGGPVIVLCDIAGASFRGGSWAPDDTLVFADSDPSVGLLSVPATGGQPKVLTRPDGAKRERDHWFPFALPNGRGVLFTIAADPPDRPQVAVLDLKTNTLKPLVQGGSDARYIDTGHLVYVADGTVRSVRFDPVRLEVLSDAVPVVDQVLATPAGAGNFAVSSNGTLIYVHAPPGPQAWPSRSLVWVDSQGREEAIPAPPRAYASPRVSPNGTRIAVEIRDGEPKIWLWDLRRKTLQRLNTDGFVERNPVWTPDGRLIFASSRAGVPNLYRQAADGSGTMESLAPSPLNQFPSSVSRDASRVFFTQLSPFADIGVLIEGERRADMLIKQAGSPEISPSGQWLAYQGLVSESSSESRQREIYVRPFPNVDGPQVRVSIDGGTRPAWAPSGRDLFYLDQRNRLTAVSVPTTGSSFTPGAPRTVLDTGYFADAGPAPGRPYDIARDRRFLMIKENATDARSTSASITVVQHWFEELKRVVPAK
jgi:eukaryotic-like serine/threonine-protein kinase